MNIENINLDDTLHTSTNYINTLIDKVLDLGIDLTDHYVDHVSFRSGGTGGEFERYVELRNQMLSLSELISEEIIPQNENGRPISIFKLNTPIDSKLGKVEYFELPAPRFGKIEIEDFTHIEIVLPEHVTLEDFFDKYENNLLGKINKEESDKQIESSNMGVKNSEIEVDFGENMKVKFHKEPIWEILIDEKQNAPNKLNFLKTDFNSKFPGVII